MTVDIEQLKAEVAAAASMTEDAESKYEEACGAARKARAVAEEADREKLVEANALWDDAVEAVDKKQVCWDRVVGARTAERNARDALEAEAEE